MSTATVLALLLTACSSGDDGIADITTVTITEATPKSSVTTEPPLTVTTEATTPPQTEETTEEITPEETTPEETAQPSPAPRPDYTKAFFDNDLFIGDSISTGLFLYGFLDKYNVFAEIGLNPDSALTKQIDGVTCIEKTAEMQPRNIYIMLGTNGLAYMDGSYMARRMAALIEGLEMACPTASIYIITIPPVTAAHEAKGNETMEMVNGYNALLKNLCTQGGYGCIDLCSKLLDDSGYFSSAYAEQDGMHFLGAAYFVMLNYVQECAE